MKSTRRALVASLLAFVLCLGMLAGTTFAWYQSAMTSGYNKIESSSLDIDVTHTNANVTEAATIKNATSLFCDADGKEVLWEPGATSYEAFTVKNGGDVAFKYGMKVTIADYNAIAGTNRTLKDVLNVLVLTGDDIIADEVTSEKIVAKFEAAKAAATTPENNVIKSIGDIDVNSGKLYPTGTEGKSSEETIQVLIYWDYTENDCEYNLTSGMTTTDGNPLYIDLGINVVAVQCSDEADAFSSDYDSEAILPEMPKSIDKNFDSAPLTIAAYDGTPASITYEGTESVTIINKNAADSSVATVPAAAVKSVVEKLAENITPKTGTDISTVLTLSVTTTETTETYVSYNIDLTAKMTYTDGDNAAQEKTLTSAQVDEVLGDNVVVATVNIGAGLNNVFVSHSGASMTALAAVDTEAEGFYYNRLTGVLTLKTKSFSPFVVTYSVPDKIVLTAKKGEAQYVSGTLNGLDFILAPLADDQFAEGKDKVNVTVTEVTGPEGAWSVCFGETDPVRYFVVEFDEGYGTVDPSATLLIKGASNVTIDAKAPTQWCGFGYPATVSGFEGTYFYAGGLYPAK